MTPFICEPETALGSGLPVPGLAGLWKVRLRPRSPIDAFLIWLKRLPESVRFLLSVDSVVFWCIPYILWGAVGSPLLSDYWCLRALRPLSILSFLVINALGMLNFKTSSRLPTDKRVDVSGDAVLTYSILKCTTFSFVLARSYDISFGLASETLVVSPT